MYTCTSNKRCAYLVSYYLKVNRVHPWLSEHSIIWTQPWFDCACVAEKAKQRKVALTIDEKLEIIDAGSSYTVIAGKYGTCIAQSTVANIKKDASKFKAFKKSMEISFQKATSKMIKTVKYKKIDKVLCLYVCMYVYCECFVLDCEWTTLKLSTETFNKLLITS